MQEVQKNFSPTNVLDLQDTDAHIRRRKNIAHGFAEPPSDEITIRKAIGNIIALYRSKSKYRVVPQDIERIIKPLADDYYSKGLAHMDKMHGLADKLLNDDI